MPPDRRAAERDRRLPAPSSGQINNQSGGNPALGPEEAKTKTIGFVWEPAPKLAVTVDYYKIDKAVSSPTTTDILDGCYSTAHHIRSFAEVLIAGA